MIEASLNSVTETLAAALSRRIALPDTSSEARLVDQHLTLSVLENYCAQLDGREGPAAISWLIQRLAELEARLLLLQGAAAARPLPEDMAALSSLVTAAPLPQAESRAILFDDLLPQRGFYPAERDETGLIFRWLGPEPVASVFVPTQRGRIRVVLNVIGVFVPDCTAQVRLSADGGAWETVQVYPYDSCYSLEATITPGRDRPANAMRIDIDAGRVASPQERGEADPRMLSIALSQLEIYAA